MQSSARISATLEILSASQNSQRIPLDGLVGDYMRNRRYIGSKDRADIVERVYNITRAHARLRWHLEQAGTTPDARALTWGWLALSEIRDAEKIATLFSGEKYAPEALSASEAAAIKILCGKTLDDDAMPEDVRVECPPDYAPSLKAYFGDAFATEMAAMLGGAPLDLRVNTRLQEREIVQKTLAKDGVKTTDTPFSPWGLRVEGKVFIAKTKAFVKGWIDIQDEGSQLIAWVCAAQPGMQVLDYCAGAGGKTLALASAMKNKGRIVATDLEKSRLEKGRARFRRAHVHDIIEVRALSDEKNRKWLRRQKETFDIALADVPCSGTGTWRRNPDMRWRVYGPSLAELLTVQAEIMDKVAKTVKPGGRFVYATCSILPEENEEQVAAFLTRHPEFEIMTLADAWAEGPVPCSGDFMRLTPHRHNTDGFFAAILRRKPDMPGSAA